MGVQNCWYLASTIVCYCQWNLRDELGLFFTPVLTLWSGGHIGCHVRRWVIVPSDLSRSFGAICAHYRYRVNHRAIIIMCAWCSPRKKGNARLLGGLSYQKNPITLLHTWLQDGRRSRFLHEISLVIALFCSLCTRKWLHNMLAYGKNLFCSCVFLLIQVFSNLHSHIITVQDFPTRKLKCS